jgi:hypothetical protein
MPPGSGRIGGMWLSSVWASERAAAEHSSAAFSVARRSSRTTQYAPVSSLPAALHLNLLQQPPALAETS